MGRVTAQVNTAILLWARKVMGYELEEVAHKLSVNPEKVALWEGGTARPTLRQLEGLSDLYRQPLVTFFRDQPPREPQWPTDYRAFPREAFRPLSPKTKTAIWEAQRRQSAAVDLRREMDIAFDAPIAELKLRSDPEARAETLRAHIGPDIPTQVGWVRERYQLFRQWRTTVEKIGMLIFRLDFPKNDARAFSLSDTSAPVIAISTEDYRNAAVFSIFHELAHLLSHESTTCNDLEFRRIPCLVKRISSLVTCYW